MSDLRTDLVLTCCCGAQLAYSCSYAPYVTREREAFDETHKVCRERRATSPVVPASVPPPPPKPDPLPNPVVPSR